MPRSLIKLNVGGHAFTTARSTLEACTFFQRLLSAEFSDLDEHGEAFIDRDPRYFHLVLNHLRSGAVELPAPPLTLEGAIAEAEYFCVDTLVEALRAHAEKHPNEPFDHGRHMPECMKEARDDPATWASGGAGSSSGAHHVRLSPCAFETRARPSTRAHAMRRTRRGPSPPR